MVGKSKYIDRLVPITRCLQEANHCETLKSMCKSENDILTKLPKTVGTEHYSQ